MEQSKTVNTLQIIPGLEPRRRLVERFNGLSRFSCGTVLAMADEDSIFYTGNYKVVQVAHVGDIAILSHLKLLYVMFREAFALAKKRSIDLVISYDPLKIGLYSLLIKLFFRAKLLIEVNSELDSQALFDFNPGFMSNLKKLAYPRIKRFVLSLADGIKGLYQGQLDSLSVKDSVVVDYFFDYTSVTVGEYKSNDVNKVLTLGFPAYIKGIDILIDSFKKLSKSHPDWQLEIIGHFNSSELSAMTKQKEGNDKIIVLKPIPFSEVQQKIDSCNIFVLASRSEGVPRVLIESMGRGRARIASTVGGIPSVIKDKEDGYLFESENVDDLSDKLANLMSSEAERKRLAQIGIKRFEQEFTLDVYVSKTEILYKKIMA